MAPGFTVRSGPFAVTDITYTIGSSDYVYANNIGYIQPKKIETKKERVKRIAKEKMHASWKVYNQKTPSVIEIKQICKPIHRVGHMGVKNFKR